VVIELFNLVILKLDLDPLIINILIIFLVFVLFITLIVSYFKGRCNKKAILLNTVIILLAIFSSGIYAMNPLLVNPSSLRIIPVVQEKNPLQELSSIAVLPIENNLGDDEHDYLLAGMHDGLITEIGKTGTIKTISRTSMKTFAETTKTIKQIGKELEVEAILESGLYTVGQAYELRLKIFDTRTEDILWTGEYTTSLPQLPTTLNAITEIVAKTIDKGNQVVIETHEDLSPEAYEHTVKGIEYIKTFDPAQIPKALPHFHRAIELDSTNIEGYLGVAKVWIYLQQIGAADPREARPIIFEFFEKAEALEPDHWKLLGVKSTVESLLNYEMKEGIRFGEESLKINPNNSDLRANLAHFYMIVGDWEKAWYHMNYAKEIDPLNTQVIAFTGMMHLYQGNLLSVSKEISILGTIQPSNLLYRRGKALLPFSKEKPKEAKRLLKDIYSYITIKESELTINEFIDKKYEETQDFKETNYHLLKYLDQHANQLNTSPSSTIARTLYRELAGYDDELFFKHFTIMDQVKNPNLPYMSIRDGNPLQDDPRYIAIMEKNGFW
jgi:TolB-like protein